MQQPLTWRDSASVLELPHTVIKHEESRWDLWGPHENDHIFRSIKNTGEFYELELLQHLRELVAHDDLVLDVGANIGNHTVWFAGVLGCDVRAFEPVPGLVQVLTRNVQLNLLSDKVRVEPFAVGASTQRASVGHWNQANTGQTRLVTDEAGDLPVVALDDLHWERSVRLIKIDVEGMETSVLQGATALIEKDRPVIVAEAQDPAADREVRRWLKAHSYEVTGVFNITPTLVAIHEDEVYSSISVGESRDTARVLASLDQVLSRFTRLEHRIDILAGRVNAAAAAARTASPSPGTDTPASDVVLERLQNRVRELETRLASRITDPPHVLNHKKTPPKQD